MEKLFPLFVTPKEKNNLPNINTKSPCAYFNDRGLCDMHNNRPIDCRLFPFDLMKINKKIYWITWDINCLILKKRRNDFEKILLEHESKIIPHFIKYLNAYTNFRIKELKRAYKYKVLRELKIDLP